MSKFVADKREPALHFVMLSSTSFSQTWAGRPRGDVACGFRLVGNVDVEQSRANAELKAVALHGSSDTPTWNETFNDGLMREHIVSSVCDPNDVTKPPPWMKNTDLEVQFLTVETVRFLFDELIMFGARHSIATKPLAPHEVMRLSTLLAAGTLETLPTALQAAHGRILRVVYDDLILSASQHAEVE